MVLSNANGETPSRDAVFGRFPGENISLNGYRQLVLCRSTPMSSNVFALSMCKSSQLSCHYISKRSRQSHFPGEILLKKDTIEQSYLNAQSPLAESLLHDQLARSRFERYWQSVSK